MIPLAGLAFLLLVATTILVSGYWLAALGHVTTLPERLAVAAVGGLATLFLWLVAVNFFLPLAGFGVVACLMPAITTLLWPSARRQLVADVRGFLSSGSGRIVLILSAVFVAALFGPALRDWQVLFYDGTTNHDSYIWITSGEFLQHHTYLESPGASQTHPWMNMADDNVGLDPRRGQLGAETLLALFSSLVGSTPLLSCLYLAGALLLPWSAAVYLTLTTFFRTRLSRPAIAAFVLFQSIFVFFYANSNLPNLLGAIMGATVIIALERALRASGRAHRVGWCVLLGLGFHGQLAVYPEMVPFVLLPCGLLWLRPWFRRQGAVVKENGVWSAAAFVVGAVINPAITVRAWRGFFFSFHTARTDDIFGNLFAPLNFAEYVPGFATLSIPAALSLGYVLGVALTVVLIAAVIFAWRRAHDRTGGLFIMEGSGVLLVYTLATGFKYGWQKSVQFSGIFVTAIMAVAVIDALVEGWRQKLGRRWAAGAGLLCIGSFYTLATALNFSQIYDWSRQKVLSRDWLALREMSATALRDQPVLIEAASFRLPFFYSMWAAYFLPSSQTYYARRGGEGGGYMRLGVLDESSVPGGRPAAVLVSRPWAESFDANSSVRLRGREYVLLREANRVTGLEGVYPLNGYPDNATTHFAMAIVPHSECRLRLTLEPYLKKTWPRATWQITRRTDTGIETVSKVSGPPPWQIDVPLLAGRSQTIDCRVVDPAEPPTQELPFPFGIRRLIVESTH